MAKLKFYSDSNHGWLAVKRKVLAEMNLLPLISHFSYERGATVYLEEDCDATAFMNAYGILNDGAKPDYEVKYIDGSSPIRSYDRFTEGTEFPTFTDDTRMELVMSNREGFTSFIKTGEKPHYLTA